MATDDKAGHDSSVPPNPLRPPHFVRWDEGETWLDVLPPGEPEPPLITRNDVLAILELAGVDVTERALRYWERGEVDRSAALPRPVRRRHNGATQALYPEWVPTAIARFRYFQHQGRSVAEASARLRNWLEALLNQPPEQRGLTRSARWSVPDWLKVDRLAYDRFNDALQTMASRVDIPRGARIVKVHMIFEDEHGFGHQEPYSFKVIRPED